jgi:aspartate aminotransferase
MLSTRARGVAPSPTLAITAKVRQLRAEGVDVVGFGAGEPDFDTPEHIKAAAIEALKRGVTKYTPTTGTPELKDAIREKLKRDNGLEYAANEIIVSVGAKHSLFNAVMALVDPGDECIVPAPYWVTYPEQVRFAGGVPVIVETKESDGFRLTADLVASAVTPRTKLLFLNSPCNPTGACVPRSELEKIAELAVERSFLVISDEIYEHLIYSGVIPTSIASLGPEVKKRTITINGVSKTYAMTGWRIGYAAADAEIVAAMGRIQDQSTSNPTSFVQPAVIEALRGPQECVAAMREEFARRRQTLVEGLNAIPGIHCSMPDGAFYVFPRVADLYGGEITGSDAFADWLLRTAKVAVVPGSGFGADQYVRLSYATSMANITKGLERIAEACAKLARAGA